MFVQATWINVLPQTEAKTNSHISFIYDGFSLWLLYQFLTSAFCLKPIFSKELIETKDIAKNNGTLAL